MTTILIAEDDGNVSDMLSNRLITAGYNTIQAADGVRALIEATNSRPDIILMDMGLPILNGWQTAQRIRSRPETCHIPIIALTAYVLNEDRLRALTAGCDEFEPKPINFDKLLAKISMLVTRTVSP